MCSSPPCTDFSQVRASPPGLQGQEGCKFRQWCQWLSSFRKALKLQHVFLLPSGEVHRELDKLVGHNSFVVDAASWGVVSRPRLWWSNVLTPPTLDSSQPPVVLAGLARWRRYNRCWQLVPSSNLFPKQNAADCPSAVFHPDVVANRSVFPCLTTPAPSASGRDPPQKRRRTESPETLRRWAAASRQFPPYQYRARALVTIQGRLTTPDAATREWLQGLPAGTTLPPGQPLSEKTRCKMLGNSWHLPTARPSVVPLPWSSNLNPLGSRPVEQAAAIWLRSGRGLTVTRPFSRPDRAPPVGLEHRQRCLELPASQPVSNVGTQVRPVLRPRTGKVETRGRPGRPVTTRRPATNRKFGCSPHHTTFDWYTGKAVTSSSYSP